MMFPVRGRHLERSLRAKAFKASPGNPPEMASEFLGKRSAALTVWRPMDLSERHNTLNLAFGIGNPVPVWIA